MTGKQFKAACAALGLSVYAARHVLGISLRQAYRYSSDDAAIPDTVARLLTLLVERGAVPEGWA